MFKQLNTNDLKATNGGIIPVIIWAFAYDRSRTAEARRQDEERRKAEVEWRRRQEGRRRVDPLPKKVVHLRVFIIACTKRASPAVQRS